MLKYLLLLLSVISTLVGLLLFKKVAISFNRQGGKIKFFSLLLNRYLIFTFLFFFIAAFVYILALREIDLAVAYSFSGLTCILVLFGAYLIFKEKINRFHLIGVFGIAIGLSVFYL